MRTDTQRIDWFVAVFNANDERAVDALQAAHTLGMTGRTAIDAAMGAAYIEPGDDPVKLTAFDRVAIELGRRELVREDDDIEFYAFDGPQADTLKEAVLAVETLQYEMDNE